LLASVFVLSFLRPNFTDEALARPVHQLVRDGKSQSQTKSENPDAKQIPVEPAPALVHREENQDRFRLPSLRHIFTPVPHPLTRTDQRPPVRNSIGVSIPSNNANARIALPASYSRPVVPGTLPVERAATSRTGSLSPRPVATGGPARGAVSIPATRHTAAAISGTGLIHRGIGPSQIGGPATSRPR
jgi:hypothetical protein